MNKDRKKDLVIGTPYAPGGGKQRGLVAAFFSSTGRKGSRLSVEAAEWSIVGEQDYAWFGYSLHNHIFKNQTLLLVGSPTWSTCKRLNSDDPSRGTQSVGKAYGTTYQVAFLSRHLHHTGTASVFELKSRSSLSPLSTLSGDWAYARFGAKIHLNDLDNDGLDEIIVTSPLRNDVTLTILGTEAGRVYMYNGNTTTPGSLTKKCKSWVSPCPEDWVRHGRMWNFYI
ncbi:hypothetical protein XELAEV_18031728mg [Xenopus laevis]|uniref:Uncharacterized protein n=1 Tax=Xenopus laevis TaxID=8355 RepID=A0A974CN43_XENLA|nr:hypothetical protein XELAEV_18031728mg [Xenopus laevis]